MTRRGPDNTVRVAIPGTNLGENFANVFWCLLATSATPTQAHLDAWVTAFGAQWESHLMLHQSSGAASVAQLGTMFLPGGSVLHSQVGVNRTGSASGTTVDDSSAAMVVSWLSSVYWRGGKPRNYIPGCLAAQTSDGHSWTSAAKTAMLADANAFIAGVNAITTGNITGTTFGFVSFRSGNVDRVPPVFFPSTGAAVHGRIGTQRRRLGKWQR